MPRDFYIQSVGPRGHKTYEVRRKGSGTMEHYTDSKREATMYASKLQRELNARRKGNPSKLTRLIQATKRGKQKRMATALKKFLKASNPAAKYAGAKIRRNAGGSITIIPVKIRKGSSK